MGAVWSDGVYRDRVDGDVAVTRNGAIVRAIEHALEADHESDSGVDHPVVTYHLEQAKTWAAIAVAMPEVK